MILEVVVEPLKLPLWYQKLVSISVEKWLQGKLRQELNPRRADLALVDFCPYACDVDLLP